MQLEPPVVPGSDEARRWAREELSKPEYRNAEPGWLDTAWKQLMDWLHSLDGSGTGLDGTVAAPLVGVAVAVLVGIAIVLARPRLNARRRPPSEVFDAGITVSSAGYRARAAAAAARQDWRAAVVEQFRAVVRAAEDRDILDPRPGRTADEMAAQLAGAFNPAAGPLNEAAHVFDAVRYGGADADSGDYVAMVGLDHLLASLKPTADRAGAKTPSVPGS
ncbi:DUF4129 domain-containing protein [Pseudarthrobacter sp. N5]|uniref:DUF4129 domain-containing protein n=1 Tax=Pseudarthrobacter sp. N5 TaxID=3418416 RepID=UPI003CFA0AC2